MKATLLCIFLSLFGTLSASAQSKAQVKPKSIYTFSATNTLSFDKVTLNKRLNLTGHKFVYIDLLDLDTNILSLNARNIGRKPTKWIHDDYFKYRDENLLKGFRLKYDPTRWNLQCPNPLSVPYAK